MRLGQASSAGLSAGFAGVLVCSGLQRGPRPQVGWARGGCVRSGARGTMRPVGAATGASGAERNKRVTVRLPVVTLLEWPPPESRDNAAICSPR